jgi:hypothetical protein
MPALGKLLTRLAATTNRIVERFGTDEFFVLREQVTKDNRGSSRKSYGPTTPSPFGCFVAVLPDTAQGLAEMRAAQRRPVVFRRFVIQTTVGVKHDDRLRLVARGDSPEVDVSVVKVTPLSGLMQEVITAEEIGAAP